MRPVLVNLWDDYAEEGLEDQNTFAYVDDQATEAQQQDVLSAVLEAILAWGRSASSPLAAHLAYHDSALVYPHLVGTEHEPFLYKRWEVKIQRLAHEEREALVAALNREPLVVGAQPVTLISES